MRHRLSHRLEVDRVGILAPIVEMAVNRCEQFGIAALAGGVVQIDRKEHQRGFAQAVFRAIACGKEAVADDSVGIPGGDCLVALDQ